MVETRSEGQSNMAGAQGQATFFAILTPYRSLTRRGFVILMALIGGVSFGIGLFFLSIGAWPVLGFFGLDFALIYIAFKLNFRSGRQYEIVELGCEALTVTRVAPSGARRAWSFNPYWVRIEKIRFLGRKQALRLFLHDRELIFGKFLTEDEMAEFADVLNMELASQRGARI